MARTARFHSPEYLDQALRLIFDIGHPVDYVASKLNISMDLLDRLVERKQAQADASLRRSTDSKKTSISAAEFNAGSDLITIAQR